MNKKLLKTLIRKTDLVKFSWKSNTIPLWSAEYLNDNDDRNYELNYILGDGHTEYNLDRGVYLYKSVRNQFKLIAVIKGDNIKVL